MGMTALESILDPSGVATGVPAMSLPKLHAVAPESLPDTTIADPDMSWGDDERIAMIAENAYYRAQSRGFMPGYEVEDWLAAEREIDALYLRDR